MCGVGARPPGRAPEGAALLCTLAIAPLSVLSARASAAWWFKSAVFKEGGIKTYVGHPDAQYLMGDDVDKLFSGIQPVDGTLTREQLVKNLPKNIPDLRTHKSGDEIIDALEKFSDSKNMIFCKVQTLDGEVKFVSPLYSYSYSYSY